MSITGIGWSYDYTQAGINTAFTGKQQYTVGAKLISQFMGISEPTAVVIYGLAGTASSMLAQNLVSSGSKAVLQNVPKGGK